MELLPDDPRQFLSTVDDFLPAEECRRLIEQSEALGFTDAPITTAAGFEMRRDIRNNTRVMVDDPTLAASLYERVRDCVPEYLSGMALCGVNERFRFYRYEYGEKFAPHYDGAFIRGPEERSLLTFMIYLNEGFTGGDTKFPYRGDRIEPRTGRALFFEHRQLHEGSLVVSGTKYVLRSDVMYRRP